MTQIEVVETDIIIEPDQVDEIAVAPVMPEPVSVADPMPAYEYELNTCSEKIGEHTDTYSANTLFGKIANLLKTFTDWVNGAWTTFYNKVGSSTQGKTLFQAIESVTIVTTDLAKESQVKDGNDTAISVSKSIKTETDKIGTSTSATNNTLFKAIENIDFDKSDLAKQDTLLAVQSSLDNEATEAEIYDMFNIAGVVTPTNASVSGTTATIQGSVSSTTATIQGSVIY